MRYWFISYTPLVGNVIFQLVAETVFHDENVKDSC